MTQVERNHHGKTSEDGAACFTIDGRASRFTVQAFATGLLSALGHNPTIGVSDLAGEVRFDPEQEHAGGLTLFIKSSSLSVQNDVSDKDRREMEQLMNREFWRRPSSRRSLMRHPISSSRVWEEISSPLRSTEA
jgi:polyisoprenoid-binding protein YceI